MDAAKTFVCVDMRASELRLAVFEKSKDGKASPMLLNCVRVTYTDGQGQVCWPLVAGALREFVGRNGLQGVEAVAGLPGHALFIRFDEMNSPQRPSRQEVLQRIMALKPPFSIDQIYYDYTAMPRGEGSWLVMSAVAQKEFVDMLAAAVSEAGLKLSAVDAVPFASIEAAFSAHDNDAFANEIVLDIDTANTTVLFLSHKDRGHFLRTLPFGTDSIDNLVAEKFNVSVGDAGRLRAQAYSDASGLTPEVVANVRQVGANVLEKIHMELRRSTKVYIEHENEQMPKRIQLAGAAAESSVGSYFQKALDIATCPFNPLRKIPVAAGSAPGDFAGISPSLGGVVGLALRHGLDRQYRLNLIEEQTGK